MDNAVVSQPGPLMHADMAILTCGAVFFDAADERVSCSLSTGHDGLHFDRGFTWVPDLRSTVVTRFGLDGRREHWMPGNRRRSTGAREKRRYTSEQEAREAMEINLPGGSYYQCSICSDWHIASPKRSRT